MKWIVALVHDMRHLWILLLLLVVGGAGFLWARSQLVPEGFGRRGPYRSAALNEIAAKPSVLHADSVCLKCHVEVKKEREKSLHKAVSCFHCHGLGGEHVAQALQAAESPNLSVQPAKKWDSNFLTHIDLYITKDRATCLSCHENVVGMPKKFLKINVEEHLDEMGAEEPESRETCFECHRGHDTAPE